MAGIIRIAILANARDAIREIGNTVRTAQGAGKKIKRGLAIGAGAVATAGIAAVGSVLRDGVGEASKFQDVGKQTAAALKTNNKLQGVNVKQVQQASAALETLTGAKIDENDATLAANKFIRAGVTSQGGLNRALKTSADVALGTGKDIGAVSTAVSKALANPAKAAGILGRTGVVLSKSQQDTIKQMVKTGNVAGAQAAVMDALESKYKGASEAAGTGFSADLGRAQDAISDAKRDITTALLPTLSTLATNFAKVLPGAIEKITPAIQTVASILTNPAFPAFAATIAGVALAVKAFTFASQIAKAATVAWTAVQWLLNVAMDANPIGLIVLAVAALVVAIVLLWKHSETFRRIVLGAWSAIRNATVALGRAIAGAFVGLWNWLVSIGRSIGTWASNLWTSFVNLGKNLMSGLVNGIAAGWQWVKDKVGQLANLIPEWTKKILGIASPSKVMAALGRNVTTGLAQGIRRDVPAVSRAMSKVSDVVTNGVGTPTLDLAASVGSVAIDGGADGVGGGTTINVTVNVPAAANPADVGRSVVKSIRAYERQLGRRLIASTVG